MSIPIIHVAQNPTRIANDNIQWGLVGFTATGKVESIQPSLPTSDTEQLLDLDGLLEIVQLIRSIKEDG